MTTPIALINTSALAALTPNMTGALSSGFNQLLTDTVLKTNHVPVLKQLVDCELVQFDAEDAQKNNNYCKIKSTRQPMCSTSVGAAVSRCIISPRLNDKQREQL